MRPGWLTLMFAAALIFSHPVSAQGDLPPAGRSRFDQLIGSQPVPFPFSRLVDAINRRMQTGSGGLPPLKITLIPLGRSLQRDAGARIFPYRAWSPLPTATAGGTPPLKDRLFLGYHEKGR